MTARGHPAQRPLRIFEMVEDADRKRNVQNSRQRTDRSRSSGPSRPPESGRDCVARALERKLVDVDRKAPGGAEVIGHRRLRPIPHPTSRKLWSIKVEKPFSAPPRRPAARPYRAELRGVP